MDGQSLDEMHIRHSKTVGVQTIMLKHPIKQKKEHPQNQYIASPYIKIPTTQTYDDRHTHTHTHTHTHIYTHTS